MLVLLTVLEMLAHVVQINILVVEVNLFEEEVEVDKTTLGKSSNMSDVQ